MKQYGDKRAAEIEIVNVESRDFSTHINYKVTCMDGSVDVVRENVKNLSTYSRRLQVCHAEVIGKVNCGFLLPDMRVIFLATLRDGTVKLLQAQEGSGTCLKLFRLCEEPVPAPPAGKMRRAEPYALEENELPQGEYKIGRDIPEGTYDFFVVYGNGGCFEKGVYDENGKIVEGTWSGSYWVGRKEEYEERELIHILCKAGETVKIRGNVVLKIARSKAVRINL